MQKQIFSPLNAVIILMAVSFLNACESVLDVSETSSEVEGLDITLSGEAENVLEQHFGENIMIDQLENYEDQELPNYINDDNTGTNRITDEGATLGRVLFYDNSLSVDESVSCASCHQQEHAFGDVEQASQGVAGTTGRHSMRLVNARFGDEERFFWDERARSLEFQTTQPIQDHVEMGFSGQDGDPSIEDLVLKLQNTEYYPPLFELAFGDPEVTEDRMQLAMAQFIRSIQSFDSRFDAGLEATGDVDDPFDNFNDLQNLGKQLFLGGPGNGPGGPMGAAPIGGAGCNACHQAPEFAIDDDSDNNGVIGVIGDPNAQDLNVTRSPTLRDLFKVTGELNGPMMHTGDFTSMEQVIDHYNNLPQAALNDNLDPRLRPRGMPQRLNLDQEEVDALVAFMKTLSGSDVYTNTKWSDPFVRSE
ncbi:MAG: cytochrome c peroxidase [Cyclobacteriaceae bacterium]